MMFWTIRNVICLVMEPLGSTVVVQIDLICMFAAASARAQQHALNLQPLQPRHHPALQHLQHRQVHPRPRPHRQLRAAQLPRCPPQQAACLAPRRQHLRFPRVPQVQPQHQATPMLLLPQAYPVVHQAHPLRRQVAHLIHLHLFPAAHQCPHLSHLYHLLMRTIQQALFKSLRHLL
jgi:hypothetical protein